MSSQKAAGARTEGADEVAILAPDPRSREALADILQKASIAARVVEGAVDHAIYSLSDKNPPTAMILDLSSSPVPEGDLKLVMAAVPGCRVIVIGEVNDVWHYRRLIQSGASDYLVKPIEPAALIAALGSAKKADAAKEQQRLGQMVVFIGTRGGVGTTTCAINTAWILAEELGQRTVLIDFDLQFGTVALSLDIDPGRGLCEALEQPARIDSLFIERAAVRQGEQLFILSAEEAIRDEVLLPPAAVEVLVHELRQKFDWVIVDMPRGLSEASRNLIAAANRVAIVVEPSLAGLRDAIRLQEFAKGVAPTTRLLMIDGGAGRAPRAQVSGGHFEKGLGRPLDAAIPFDPKVAAASANAGMALAALAPQSPAAKAVRKLAEQLGGRAPAKAARPRLWRRKEKG